MTPLLESIGGSAAALVLTVIALRSIYAGRRRFDEHTAYRQSAMRAELHFVQHNEEKEWW